MPANKSSRRKRPAKHKTRQSLKERASDFSDSSDQVFEEITALSAIFQDDFNLVSEQPVAEFSIQLRPHSVDDDDVEQDASAELVVRCLPGYPQKPPKLHVIPKTGLSSEQSHRLHSLLVEQAASRAREGRVMVFNLTEAAQEFLSENRPTHTFSEAAQGGLSENQLTYSASETFIQGSVATLTDAEDESGVSEDSVFFDLFTSSWGENDNHWDEGFDPTLTNSRIHMEEHDTREQKHVKKGVATVVPLGGDVVQKGAAGNNKRGQLKGPMGVVVLPAVKEVDDEEKVLQAVPRDTHSQSVSEILQRVRSGLARMGAAVKQSVLLNRSSSTPRDSVKDDEGDDSTSSSEEELPVSRSRNDAATQSIQKDLVLGHLLRLVCGTRGPLPNALPVLAAQLEDLGILPKWVEDLVVKDQPDVFDATFRQTFPQQATDMSFSSDTTAQPSVSHFWDASSELLGERDASAASHSRYLSDFEEISLLGKGGFGHVVLCENKLDGRRYAMKKIRLKVKTLSQNNKILREVATLARLQHQHVVRYYQAWIETGLGSIMEKLNSGSEVTDSEGDWLSEGLSNSKDLGAPDPSKGEQGSTQTTYLYIQMEFCPRTLREVFNLYKEPVDKEATWRIFRQIVEGLAHIHSRGIIHRDLTPNNIFFDVRNDIKIGDFGLAKFANLEQPDLDPNPLASAHLASGSLEGTGAVGTYFYTAPEIDQGWLHIDEKVDMYSLGVVLFELWYHFTTGMERQVILSDLKLKGMLPPTWSAEFVPQAALVRWLTAPQPSDRPSAVQVLRSELLPPRRQDEALNDILRMIQHAEDTTVYDQVVAAIFDDERVAAKGEHLERERTKSNLSLSRVEQVGVQDFVRESVREVFMRHGARPIESTGINVLDDPKHLNRLAVRLVDSSGNMLHLRYETRVPFACWIAANQPTSLKRYQIARVYRRGVGNNAPQEFLQGDFDLVGGARSLAEAEVIKVAAEVVAKFPVVDLHEVRLNHRHLLNAIWTWAGVKRKDRGNIAQVLAMVGGASPRSSARKALWPLVRRQLLQGLQVPEVVVDRLQTVERRLSGSADESLARLRGILPPSTLTSATFDELSMLLGFLRIWGLDKLVNVDALMPPSEDYFDGSYFQIHVRQAGSGSTMRDMISPICLAVGGRYDRLLHRYWATNLASPGAVGLTIGVQRLISLVIGESKQEASAEVLVCSRGGSGLLAERLQVVAELWAANIKAEYMCSTAPSLTEQYEYAHEHGMKWLVIISEAALSLTGKVKVRHLELKAEEEVPREDLVKYFTENSMTSMNLKKRTQRYGT